MLFRSAPKGTVISFHTWMLKPEMHGYLRSMTIGNGRPMLIRAWGFKDGIMLPNQSIIFFEPNRFCADGCVPKGEELAYWIMMCRYAVLGADAKLPKIGLVKKGTMIKFSGSKNPTCAEDEIYGTGMIEIVNDKVKESLLNEWVYKR